MNGDIDTLACPGNFLFIPDITLYKFYLLFFGVIEINQVKYFDRVTFF